MTGHRRPPLVLTGGPAAGKTTTGRTLAENSPRAAFIDADDVRLLVVRGLVPVWRGPVGRQQMDLGARNVAALARNFHDDGFDVVIADVLDPDTVPTYRRHLPDAVVVHLVVSFPEAQRRAATRPVHITDDEFAWLHRRDQAHPPAVDVRLDVDHLDLADQVAAVDDAWTALSAPHPDGGAP